MKVGSLCSGYGGLDMVFDDNVAWHAEVDPDASKVLAHNWPKVPNLGDLTTVDWTEVEPVDWLTAGYPCQPFSLAGKRNGAEDTRHIWPHIAEAIRVLQPRYALLENVRGHLSLGFDTVLGSLARLGYDAQWGVVRASDAGAPHQRARVFIVATNTDRQRGNWCRIEGPRGWKELAHRGDAAAHADGERVEGCESAPGPDAERERASALGRSDLGPGAAWGAYASAISRWERIIGRSAPEPTEPGRNRPRLAASFVEWMMGLPEGHVTGVPGLSRTAQLKVLGNGVVPQQAALALRMLHG